MTKTIIAMLLAAVSVVGQEQSSRAPARSVVVPEMPANCPTVTVGITLVKADLDAIWDVIKDVKEIVPGASAGEIIQRNAYKDVNEALQKLVSAWVSALKERADTPELRAARAALQTKQDEMEALRRTPVVVQTRP